MKYNSSTVYYYLNNYDYSPDNIEKVRKFLETGAYPENILTPAKKRHYANRWKDFEWKQGHLFFQPLNLEVIVDKDEKQEKMKALYDDTTTGIGVGKRGFYHIVVNKYLNIKRRESDDFLTRQKVFQITRPLNHKVNKPILASEKGERYSIDLIELLRYAAQNRGYKYILTCIDNYTRMSFARSLKNKTAIDVRDAMIDICNEAGIKPRLIHCDQGTEFRGEFEEWMRENNIKWTNSRSYSPQSNGLVENLNGQIRKMIREMFIRNNNTIWYSHLQTIMNAKNGQYNSTIKTRPIDVWEGNGNRMGNDPAANIRERARKQVLRNTTKELHVGDYVRIKMSALYSSVRKMIKEATREKKYIVVKYTPEVFRVKSLLNPDHAGLEKQRYTVEDLNGQELRTNNGGIKRFFATELMKIDAPNADNEQRFTTKDALKLNKVVEEEGDVHIGVPAAEERRPRRQLLPTRYKIPERERMQTRRRTAVVGGNLIEF
jgi:transposase InsO family protein